MFVKLQFSIQKLDLGKYSRPVKALVFLQECNPASY